MLVCERGIDVRFLLSVCFGLLFYVCVILLSKCACLFDVWVCGVFLGFLFLTCSCFMFVFPVFGFCWLVCVRVVVVFCVVFVLF